MAEEQMEASSSAKKAKIDWRDKCIRKFKLQPVPEAPSLSGERKSVGEILQV
jgi:hypothetical protein